jgi:hypothetical protein
MELAIRAAIALLMEVSPVETALLGKLGCLNHKSNFYALPRCRCKNASDDDRDTTYIGSLSPLTS